MVASAEGKMLQAAYETLDAFEEAIRAGARGDLSEEGRDAARTAIGNVLDEMAESLYRERRRVAAAIAVLNAPMWESDDETDETICRCEWCMAETAKLAATYRCRDCGYQGQPMAWGCLDPKNVEHMSRERGEDYSMGDVICPICGGGQGFESDPWATLRAIRAALAADVPGQPGEEGQGQ